MRNTTTGQQAPEASKASDDCKSRVDASLRAWTVSGAEYLLNFAASGRGDGQL